MFPSQLWNIGTIKSHYSVTRGLTKGLDFTSDS